MASLKSLSDYYLILAYQESIDMGLDYDFIELLEEEITLRGLTIKNKKVI